MREKGLWALFAADKRASDLQKVKETKDKAQKEADAKQKRQIEELQRQQQLVREQLQREQIEQARVLFIQSGVAYLIKKLAEREKTKVEYIWDQERGVYGQRIVWDKKLRDRNFLGRKIKHPTRGEHYLHLGGLLMPGIYWGKEIGEYRGKMVEVTVSAHNPNILDISGRRRRSVPLSDEEGINVALGKAYIRPGKFRRREYVK